MILFCCIIDRSFFANFEPETNIDFKSLVDIRKYIIRVTVGEH